NFNSGYFDILTTVFIFFTQVYQVIQSNFAFKIILVFDDLKFQARLIYRFYRAAFFKELLSCLINFIGYLTFEAYHKVYFFFCLFKKLYELSVSLPVVSSYQFYVYGGIFFAALV